MSDGSFEGSDMSCKSCGAEYTNNDYCLEFRNLTEEIRELKEHIKILKNNNDFLLWRESRDAQFIQTLRSSKNKLKKENTMLKERLGDPNEKSM